MSPNRDGDVRCLNEGCFRTPEPGEPYCSACALERSLFRRDERRPDPSGTALPEQTADRR